MSTKENISISKHSKNMSIDSNSTIVNVNSNQIKQQKSQIKKLQKQLQNTFMREMDWYKPFKDAVCGFKPNYSTTNSKCLLRVHVLNFHMESICITSKS